MFCPNCGKDCGNGKFCTECGQRIDLSDDIEATGIMETPIGRYEGTDGYIELSFYTMTIHKEIFSQVVERTISYDNLLDVAFQQAIGDGFGYLAVREITDKLPLVKTEMDAAVCETALIFDSKMNRGFCKAYSYLKQCVGDGATKSCEAQAVRSDTKTSTEIYCAKCNSNRVVAHVKSYYRPYVRGKSVVLALVMCFLYLYYRFFVKKVEYVCLDCGNRWT